MPIQATNVVVALSGGIDSALTAALLKEQGWKVFGLHFLLPVGAEKTAMNRESVRRISQHLKIPLEFVSLQDPFTRLIIDPFVKAYQGGLTPNPCVACNVLIKFEQLMQYANAHDLDYVATGHYAEIRHARHGIPELRRAKDRSKDQSYFLHRLKPGYVSRVLFPLSMITKKETRELALQMDLPGYQQAESQEICFLPDKDYRVYLESRMDRKDIVQGDIVDQAGCKLGKHAGVHRYTIGQRHGLGIASERPYYVKEIKPDKNQIVVGRKEEIFSSVVKAEDFHWLIQEAEQESIHCSAQIRYRHDAAPGRLEILSNREVRFVFDEPQWAITPGQALVCYQEDRVIGGGWIVKSKGQEVMGSRDRGDKTV